jgi:hypothetical protein
MLLTPTQIDELNHTIPGLELGTLLAGNQVHYAHADIGGAAPTNVECIAAFGTAASSGAGFRGVYQDDHASGKTYLVICNGIAYSTIQATAAV